MENREAIWIGADCVESGFNTQQEVFTQSETLLFLPVIRLADIILCCRSYAKQIFHACFRILAFTASQGDPASGFA